MSAELVGWLRAQIDEDERWLDYEDGGYCDGGIHLDRERWQREVEAKRRILTELERLPHFAWDGRDEYGCPKHTDLEVWRFAFGEDVEQTCNCGRDDHVSRTLRLLALPYSDRPGYREEWAA